MVHNLIILLATAPVPIGTIAPPLPIADYPEGARGVENFTTIILAIIFSIASLIFLFMIVFGAVQWITSGGDKEKIAGARGRIVNAIIGLAILGLAFLIANIIGTIFGFGSITKTALLTNYFC
jgi:hypothetical protein